MEELTVCWNWELKYFDGDSKFLRLFPSHQLPTTPVISPISLKSIPFEIGSAVISPSDEADASQLDSGVFCATKTLLVAKDVWPLNSKT